MLPIGDLNPRRHFPIATVLIIGLNVLVFLYQVMIPEAELQQFILEAGVIPYEVTNRFGPDVAQDLLTCMFLHGSWMHIGGNMLYLWIFGDNIEDWLGTAWFVIFYLAAGIAASLAQVAAGPESTIPTIGASGAIAGVLGCYLVLFPHARVRTVVFLLRFIRFIELPALVVLGFWFVLQFLQGVGSLGAGASGGVAWFAHIGGFVAGVLVGLLVRRSPARKRRSI